MDRLLDRLARNGTDVPHFLSNWKEGFYEDEDELALDVKNWIQGGNDWQPQLEELIERGHLDELWSGQADDYRKDLTERAVSLVLGALHRLRRRRRKAA